MKLHNVRLASTAKSAGVVAPKDYAIFQDHGYKGLYGGLTARDIHEQRGLKKSQQILDHMGSTELAANLFRATQTEEKLRRDKITGKERANRTHFEVGAKVRKTIQELEREMCEFFGNLCAPPRRPEPCMDPMTHDELAAGPGTPARIESRLAAQQRRGPGAPLWAGEDRCR
jgi:hypothetical protein